MTFAAKFARSRVAAAVLFCLFLSGPRGWGQAASSEVPSLVEIYWKSSRTVAVPGISNIIVLDQEIARAETGADTVEFFGLARGETVALGYIGDNPVSIRVRVMERPTIPVSPSLLRRRDEMVQGSFSSNVQVADVGGTRTIAVVNGFSWAQPIDRDSRFEFNSQMEDNTVTGGHVFNVRQATALYHSPDLDVRGLDFNVSLTGDGVQHFTSPFATSDMLQIRGGGLALRDGDNQYSLYAGTTIPYYFLTLGSTRDVAGFSFQRKETAAIGIFTNTAYINAPLDFLGLGFGRRNNVMQTAGLTFMPNQAWAAQMIGGVSNRGGMGRAELAYNGHRASFYASGAMSSALFPLNQIESILSGTSSFKGGFTYRSSDRITEYLSYQHTITKALTGILRDGSSDYLSPGVSARVSGSEDFSFSYIYSRNSGAFSSVPSTGNRADFNWHSQLSPRVSNSAQITAGSLQDPLQLNSQDQFSLRDSLSFPVIGGSLTASFAWDRTNPSLVEKLNAELVLLSPALQNLFLSDPVSFVNSSNLPPEIRALLNAQQPISMAVSCTGQLRLANRLSLNPSASFARISNGTTESWTPFVGYGLNYQVTPSFQLNSGLNSVWVYTSSLTQPQRTTIFSAGFVKRFITMPATFVPGRGRRMIQGRVFRDNKIKGVFSAGDKGFEGLRVRLDTGEVDVTDELGRYRFLDVEPGEHEVTLDLTQFREPVRMTTRSRVTVDLIRDRVAIADFGVVNFARLMGNIYNDLRFEGRRQPDAKGLPEVRLTLENSREKRVITTNGSGDFEAADVPPGYYTLTIDPASLPANYVVAGDPAHVHVTPVSTVVQDISVRALRSVAGRVMLKVAGDPAGSGKLKVNGVPQSNRQSNGRRAGQAAGQAGGEQTWAGANAGEAKLVPMAGIQITAGFGVVKTDEDGNFLLRDLPAGDVTISLVPLRPLPDGMKVPSGTVRMPADPVQIQGATIVIGNPELVPFLLGKSAGQVRDEALRAVVKNGDAGQAELNAKPAPQPAPAVDTTRPAGGGAF
ncbi:MAG TPA: hypothetical protein VKW06_15060 [Candidatus Angelobacter sp.]|nr:hypothetical protein [Candidatus Angelobacter sp.]